MASSVIGRLDTAIRAVAPVLGISIGVVSDRSTWRVDFDPAATPQQIAAANAVVAAFDPNAVDPTEQRIQDYLADNLTKQMIAIIDGNSLAQLDAFVVANVTNITTAQTAIKMLMRLAVIGNRRS